MVSIQESLKEFVGNIQLLDKHYSPPIHHAIEAVAGGDKAYPTLLLGLATMRMQQQGISNDESITFLDRALAGLKPRSDIEYQLMDSQTQQDRFTFLGTLPDKIHSLSIGELKYDPTILLHHLVVDMLYTAGYSPRVSLNVLRNGTQDLIKWRDSFTANP